MFSVGTGLSKFAWLARSVARNRSALFPSPAAAAATGAVGGGTVMTSVPPTSDAPNNDIPSQNSNVRHLSSAFGGKTGTNRPTAPFENLVGGVLL